MSGLVPFQNRTAMTLQRGLPATSLKYTSRPPPGTPLDPGDLKRRLDEVIVFERAAARVAGSRSWRRQKGNTSFLSEKDTANRLKGDIYPRQGYRQCQDQPYSHSEAVSYKEGRGPDGFHHMPRVAAAQFTRTTSTDSWAGKPYNTLSRAAIRFHIEGPNADPWIAAMGPDTAPNEHMNAFRKDRESRAHQYDRNQFQHSAWLTSAVEDQDRYAQRAYRHTFTTFPISLGSTGDDGMEGRRASTGELQTTEVQTEQLPGGLIRMIEPFTVADHIEHVGSADERRVDWTQHDEAISDNRRNVPQESGANVLKSTLRSRLGSLRKSLGDSRSPEKQANTMNKSLRSPRSSFLTRFRRRPDS